MIWKISLITLVMAACLPGNSEKQASKSSQIQSKSNEKLREIKSIKSSSIKTPKKEVSGFDIQRVKVEVNELTVPITKKKISSKLEDVLFSISVPENFEIFYSEPIENTFGVFSEPLVHCAEQSYRNEKPRYQDLPKVNGLYFYCAKIKLNKGSKYLISNSFVLELAPDEDIEGVEDINGNRGDANSEATSKANRARLADELPETSCDNADLYHSENPVKVTKCDKDGQVGCITTATFRAADTSNFDEKDLLLGREIAGIKGITRAYPICERENQVSCVTTESLRPLDIGSIDENDIVVGKKIGNIEGAAVIESRVNCSSDNQVGCITTEDFKSVDSKSIKSKHIAVCQTIAGVKGSAIVSSYGSCDKNKNKSKNKNQ